MTSEIGQKYPQEIIDDVAIWNRALTVAEVAEVMANGTPAAVEASGELATTWAAIEY